MGDYAPRESKRSFGGLLFAILWCMFLFLLLPAVQVLPLPSRMVHTLVSAAAGVAMTRGARSWRLLATLPLWLALVFSNYLVWTFQNWTSEDYFKSREEHRLRFNNQHKFKSELRDK